MILNYNYNTLYLQYLSSDVPGRRENHGMLENVKLASLEIKKQGKVCIFLMKSILSLFIVFSLFIGILREI